MKTILCCITILLATIASTAQMSTNTTTQVYNSRNNTSEKPPVRFVSFTASNSSAGVCLRWATEEEYNNSHYELQRSYNGTDFTTIAYMMSAEEGIGHAVYSYRDKLGTKRKMFYRIMQVDNAGHISFSNIAIIKGESKKDKEDLSAYPAIVNENDKAMFKKDATINE
jgi:hypothetical protein